MVLKIDVAVAVGSFVRDRLLDWLLVWIEDVGFRSVDGRPI